MKKHYLLAKRLSLWMRTVNKWKNLRNSFSGIWSTSQWKKFNNLNSILGLKKKVAFASLAGLVALGAQAQTQDDYVQITNRGEQILRAPILSTLHPSFVDLDNDGDLDLITADRINNGVRAFINEDNVFNEVSGEENPIHALSISIRSQSKNVLIDLDNDGDLDLISGLATTGLIEYRENQEGVYVKQEDEDNPFNGIDVLGQAHPNFKDFDNDGDLDLILGRDDGKINFYSNEEGVFTEQTGVDNPFGSIDVGNRSSPFLIDMDSDNDLDLVVGEYSGNFNYFENVGGDFTQITGEENPFNNTERAGSASSPAFFDVDNDGDLDLITSEPRSRLLPYFENNEGAFELREEMENPFGGIHVSEGASGPHFVDLDGDGDLDLISGGYEGRIFYFGNEDNVFGSAPDSLNPFTGSSVWGNYSARFTSADIDQDGDQDLLAGDVYGGFTYFKNNEGEFILQVNDDDIFDDLNVGNNSTPVFADVDKDGDLDLISGNNDGAISFFENTGGVFTEKTDQDNPFDFIAVGNLSAPTFSDVDVDGDLDLVIGNGYGNVSFFENTGGVFTEKTGVDNPFGHIDIDSYSSVPTFVDLDGDQDLDLVIGISDGTFIEFENTSGLTGVFSNVKIDQLSVYPNPTSSIINTEKGTLEIMDLTGNTVLSTESTGQVDVSVLESGVYIVTQNGKKTKLIIE